MILFSSTYLVQIIQTFTRYLYFTDIKVKEPTEESITKKVRQYMDPKFMSVNEAANQLVQIIESKPGYG